MSRITTTPFAGVSCYALQPRYNRLCYPHVMSHGNVIYGGDPACEFRASKSNCAFVDIVDTCVGGIVDTGAIDLSAMSDRDALMVFIGPAREYRLEEDTKPLDSLRFEGFKRTPRTLPALDELLITAKPRTWMAKAVCTRKEQPDRPEEDAQKPVEFVWSKPLYRARKAALEFSKETHADHRADR